LSPSYDKPQLHLIYAVSAKASPYADQVISADQISISAAMDATICLPVSQQLLIQFDNKGFARLSVKRGTVTVNGKQQSSAELQEGDVIQLAADASLTYLGFAREQFAIQINHSGTRSYPRQHKTDKPGSHLQKWYWFALLLLSVAIGSIPWWLPNLDSVDLQQSAISKSMESWLTSGPLHEAHATVVEQCSDCHRQSYSKVDNEQCFACHTMKRHITREQTGNHPLCVTCHLEHNEPNNLINLDQQYCVMCHAGTPLVDFVLAAGHSMKHDPVTDLELMHPEFSPVDPAVGQFNFSHQQHMRKEGLTVNGETRKLSCNSCHQADEMGKDILPVNMEQHCGDCHSLSLEIPEQGAKLNFAHGDIYRLRFILQDQLGLKTQSATHDAMGLLFSAQGSCGTCHRGVEIKDSPSLIEDMASSIKVAYPHFDNARFSHKKHEGNLQCLDCHTQAADSENAQDSLLPAKQVCSNCHSSHPASKKRVTTCAECHRFHTIDWE
jgi:hypothetical protein